MKNKYEKRFRQKLFDLKGDSNDILFTDGATFEILTDHHFFKVEIPIFQIAHAAYLFKTL